MNGIKMKIFKVKNIEEFEFVIPNFNGLYALTGENGSGKSTVISCAAAAFYVPSFNDYYGKPRLGAKIEFEFNNRKRCIFEKDGEWKFNGSLGITGFYEGSIVFGNRFKDIDYSLLSKLSTITENDLESASNFVAKSLGKILRNDDSHYNDLYALKMNIAKRMGFTRRIYYYKNKGVLINQLNMSTGENLLLTILDSIQYRLKKEVFGENPAFMFLDEIELALHSSALRRLVFFLQEISQKYNTMILFSTHSIELIRSISASNIYYLQNYVDGSLGLINPCYPIYATRNLESSNYGHDYLILVEDNLSKMIVEKILADKHLLSNKRVLVIAIGGWCQVINFAYDAIRTNLMIKNTKILIILDGDIEYEAKQYMKNEHIGFANYPNFLPIKSLEKYLLDVLINNVDINLFRELNDYIFQGKSLDDLTKEYKVNVSLKKYDKESIKNGKAFYSVIKHELDNIRKTDDVLVAKIVEYLFECNNKDVVALTDFFVEKLKQ